MRQFARFFLGCLGIIAVVLLLVAAVLVLTGRHTIRALRWLIAAGCILAALLILGVIIFCIFKFKRVRCE